MSSKKLFSKDIEPRCFYCLHSSSLNEKHVLCSKNGVVDCSYKCKSFKYDPLKRVPPKPAILRGKFSDEDFSLIDD